MLINANHHILHISIQIQDLNIAWLNAPITSKESYALRYVQSDIILIQKFVKNAIKPVRIVQGHHKINAHYAYKGSI